MSSHNSNNENSINGFPPEFNMLLQGVAFSNSSSFNGSGGFRITEATPDEGVMSALAALEHSVNSLNPIPEESEPAPTAAEPEPTSGAESDENHEIPEIADPLFTMAFGGPPTHVLGTGGPRSHVERYVGRREELPILPPPPIVSMSRAINRARNVENITQFIWELANQQMERQILRSVMEESFQEDQERRLMEQSKPLKITVADYGETKKEFDECRICMEKFTEDAKVCALPCGHYFCETCIREWGKRKPNCPFCEAEIPLQEDETDEPAPKKLKSQ